MIENQRELIVPTGHMTYGEPERPQLQITTFSDGTRATQMTFRDMFKDNPALVIALPDGERVAMPTEPEPYRPFTSRIASLALTDYIETGSLPQWFTDALS